MKWKIVHSFESHLLISRALKLALDKWYLSLDVRVSLWRIRHGELKRGRSEIWWRIECKLIINYEAHYKLQAHNSRRASICFIWSLIASFALTFQLQFAVCYEIELKLLAIICTSLCFSLQMEIICLFSFVGVSFHSRVTTFKNNVALEMLDPQEEQRRLL